MPHHLNAVPLEMESIRKACQKCGREALIETIRRNEGFCESCKADGPELKPWVRVVLSALTFLMPLMITAFVSYKCNQTGWPMIWIIIGAVFVLIFSFVGCGYIVSLTFAILAKFRIGIVFLD